MTADAVWIDSGAASTFAVGVAFFGDTASLEQFLEMGRIVDGTFTLNLAMDASGVAADDARASPPGLEV